LILNIRLHTSPFCLFRLAHSEERLNASAISQLRIINRREPLSSAIQHHTIVTQRCGRIRHISAGSLTPPFLLVANLERKKAVAKSSHTVHHVDNFQERHASIVFIDLESAQSRSRWHIAISIASAEPGSKSQLGLSHLPDISAGITCHPPAEQRIAAHRLCSILGDFKGSELASKLTLTH
jgi:hypothetical protein